MTVQLIAMASVSAEFHNVEDKNPLAAVHGHTLANKKDKHPTTFTSKRTRLQANSWVLNRNDLKAS